MKKDLVFMFKNQKYFRQDETIDLKMLKISIKQWNKLYENAGKTYICGEYSQKDLEDLFGYLGDDFCNKYDIKVINVDKIPSEFNKNKSIRVNYQMLFAWEVLKKDFVLCANDIFPIKKISDDYINKEYAVKYKDYTKIPKEKRYWWLNNYINFLEYFNKKFNTNFKEVYEGHSFYAVDKEFIEFFKSDEKFIFEFDRDVVLINYLKMKGENVFKPGFIGTTFIANKWVWDKKKEKQYKGINVTLPNHPKSKSLLSKILIK